MLIGCRMLMPTEQAALGGAMDQLAALADGLVTQQTATRAMVNMIRSLHGEVPAELLASYHKVCLGIGGP